MYLHAYAEVTVLFKDWKPTNAGSMAGLCFLGAAMAFAAEACSAMLERGTKHGSFLAPEHAPLLAAPKPRSTQKKRNTVVDQMYGMFLSGSSLTLGLLAMLVAMTYNIWLVVAVIGTCGAPTAASSSSIVITMLTLYAPNPHCLLLPAPSLLPCLSEKTFT